MTGFLYNLKPLKHITDYRRIPRAISNVYFHPLSREKKDEFDKLFVALATRNGKHVTHDRELHVWGRKLAIPASADNVAKFTFDELCGHPLSAADYLEVTKTFNTIFLSDVPKMNLNQKDKVSLDTNHPPAVHDVCLGETIYHVH